MGDLHLSPADGHRGSSERAGAQERAWGRRTWGRAEGPGRTRASAGRAA